MGSCYVSQTYADCDQKTLIDKVERAIESSAFESGHSYSGNWGSKRDGVTVLSQVFDSVKDAEDYFMEHNDKWGPLFAARAMNLAALTPENKGAKLLALEAKYKALQQKQQDFMPTIRKRAMEAKSELKACTGCRSKINIKAFLKRQSVYSFTGACPICNDNLLLTDTDKSAQKKLAADVEATAKAVEEAGKARAKAVTKKAETVWVVGGWCSS